MTDDTYFITGGGHGRGQSRRLHTKESCGKLQQARGYIETPRDRYPDHDLCPFCTDAFEPHRGGSSGPHERLKALGENDA